MRLFLIRHAEAVNAGTEGVRSDFDRHLTEHGLQTANALAAWFGSHSIELSAIVQSGFVRARQTAEPLIPLLARDAMPMMTITEFAPDTFKPKRVSEQLDDLKVKTVAVVGHMPNLGAYASWLLGLDRSLDLEKGGVVCLKIRGAIGEGRGTLEWMVIPSFYQS